MAIAEKNIVITSKDELNQTVIYKPYTSVYLVEGAVSSINGITPDDNGNVNISRIDNANNAKSADSVEWNNVKNKPTNVSSFSNDAGYLTQHQSLDGYAKTSVANTWTAQQTFNAINIGREHYNMHIEEEPVGGTIIPSTASVGFYPAGGTSLTLDMSNIVANLKEGEATVFTAFVVTAGVSDSALIVNGIDYICYVGSAADVSIAFPATLINIFIIKVLTKSYGVVQASKLEVGA